MFYPAHSKGNWATITCLLHACIMSVSATRICFTLKLYYVILADRFELHLEEKVVQFRYLAFFKIFHYLDTIVINHNKIIDLVCSLGKNKYIIVLFLPTRLLACLDRSFWYKFCFIWRHNYIGENQHRLKDR